MSIKNKVSSRLGVFIAVFLFFVSQIAISQNTGIGTISPHPSSALEIADSSRGILIPRMTLAQRNAIQDPAEGLMVYQTDSTKGFWYWDGSQWLSFQRRISSDSVSNVNYKFMKIFDAPGNYSWTVPQGVTKVVAELWGGGGGIGGVGGTFRIAAMPGSWTYRYGGLGGNGGAGGYNKSIIHVNPGQTISIVVGSGGNPSSINGSEGVSNGATNYPATPGGNGQQGGASYFNFIMAPGGEGGQGGQPGSWYNNGSQGAAGNDGLITNYSYPYNSFQQLRSYLPVSYIPVYPTPRSKGGDQNTRSGENGFVIVFYGE